MKRYCGGELAPQGAYWNLASWEFAQSPEPGSVLPGGTEERYIRLRRHQRCSWWDR